MRVVRGLGFTVKALLGLGLAAICWAAFLWARPAQNFVGESSRIVFFHVPMAWVSTLAFFIAAWHSAVYLRKRRIENDDAAAGAARLGFVFCVLAAGDAFGGVRAGGGRDGAVPDLRRPPHVPVAPSRHRPQRPRQGRNVRGHPNRFLLLHGGFHDLVLLDVESRPAGVPHRPREGGGMSGALGYVAAVNIVIWAGIFGYLVYLDRKVRAASGPGQEKPR